MVAVLDEQEIRHGLHRLGNVLAIILVHTDSLMRESGNGVVDRHVLRSISDAALRGRDTLRQLHRAAGITDAPPGAGRDDGGRIVGGTSADARRTRLLLIEDNAEVRGAFASVLERAGYDVEAASTGFEGIECYRARRFDCVVTDFDLPGINGLTVSRAIKDADPGAWVVLLTGGGLDLEPAAIAAAGVDRVETKPLTYAQIVALGARPERTR